MAQYIRSQSTDVPLKPTVTISSTTHVSVNDLPLLPYDPWQHKAGIAITWTVLFFNTSLLPIILVFALSFGTNLKENTVFGIVLGTFGVGSLYQFWRRMFRLLQRDPIYRPIGSRRGWLDFYQINTAISICVSTALLVAGTVQTPVAIHLVAVPPAILTLWVSSMLLITAILSRFGIRTQCRVSSLSKGLPIRSGIYTVVEDVMGVDAGCGRPYREALNARYEASPHFRRMLWQLTYFWGLAGEVIGIVVIGVCHHVSQYVAFAIGWTIPFLWAIVWAFITIRWVQVELRKEKEARKQNIIV